MLRISKDLFHSVIRENPEAAIELIRILSVRLANMNEIISNLPKAVRA